MTADRDISPKTLCAAGQPQGTGSPRTARMLPQLSLGAGTAGAIRQASDSDMVSASNSWRAAGANSAPLG